MKMKQVQTMAVDGLREAFKDASPRVYVEPFEGILSFTVASNRYSNTPLFLVSPVAEDSNSVTLAIYFLATSADRGQIEILDKAIAALRALPGEGRIPLEVSSKSLYDDNALKKGLRIWAVMTAWPHLSDGVGKEDLLPGPVAKAMQDISQLFPNGTEITLSESERRNWLFGHKLPFVTLRATKASFDTADRRRVFGIKDYKRFEALAKGMAKWIIEVTAYGKSEVEAEKLVWPIVPYIPEVISDDYGFNTYLKVAELEEGEESGGNTFTVRCTLEVPAYRSVKTIPSIKTAHVLGKEDKK